MSVESGLITHLFTLPPGTPVYSRPTTEIKDFWDKKACVWATGNLIENSHVRRINQLVKEMIGSLPSNARVLELACGSNNKKYYPAQFDFDQLTAVDISQKMLSYLGFTSPEIHNKIVADARSVLPFLDNSFDIAFCFFGMRYFENQEEVISELIRVTKPNGGIGVVDYDNYVYESAVRIFDPCCLQSVVLTDGHMATVHQLAQPLFEGNPSLYFLSVEKIGK